LRASTASSIIVVIDQVWLQTEGSMNPNLVLALASVLGSWPACDR